MEVGKLSDKTETLEEEARLLFEEATALYKKGKGRGKSQGSGAGSRSSSKAKAGAGSSSDKGDLDADSGVKRETPGPDSSVKKELSDAGSNAKTKKRNTAKGSKGGKPKADSGPIAGKPVTGSSSQNGTTGAGVAGIKEAPDLPPKAHRDADKQSHTVPAGKKRYRRAPTDGSRKDALRQGDLVIPVKQTNGTQGTPGHNRKRDLPAGTGKETGNKRPVVGRPGNVTHPGVAHGPAKQVIEHGAPNKTSSGHEAATGKKDGNGTVPLDVHKARPPQQAKDVPSGSAKTGNTVREKQLKGQGGDSGNNKPESPADRDADTGKEQEGDKSEKETESIPADIDANWTPGDSSADHTPADSAAGSTEDGGVLIESPVGDDQAEPDGQAEPAGDEKKMERGGTDEGGPALQVGGERQQGGWDKIGADDVRVGQEGSNKQATTDWQGIGVSGKAAAGGDSLDDATSEDDDQPEGNGDDGQPQSKGVGDEQQRTVADDKQWDGVEDGGGDGADDHSDMRNAAVNKVEEH
jgi:hypothetical protein